MYMLNYIQYRQGKCSVLQFSHNQTGLEFKEETSKVLKLWHFGK